MTLEWRRRETQPLWASERPFRGSGPGQGTHSGVLEGVDPTAVKAAVGKPTGEASSVLFARFAPCMPVADKAGDRKRVV